MGSTHRATRVSGRWPMTLVDPLSWDVGPAVRLFEGSPSPLPTGLWGGVPWDSSVGPRTWEYLRSDWVSDTRVVVVRGFQGGREAGRVL